MDLSSLSKHELYDIAISDIDLSHRYEAIRELQLRRINNDDFIDIIKMAPTHSPKKIAEYLGIRYTEVTGVLLKYNLFRRKEV